MNRPENHRTVMNIQYEKQLEASVQRELKALGELKAPPEIAARVMCVIEKHAIAPWYRRAWQTWPPAIRGVSLAGLLVMFSLLSFGLWWLVHAATISPAAREVSGWFSLADAIWSAAITLITALVLVLRSLNPAMLIGGVVMLLLCYAVCVALGSIYLRLAVSPLKGGHYENEKCHL
jgi:uncharacterized membrane protein